MPLKAIKDTDLLTFDNVSQAWRKNHKGGVNVVSKAANYTILTTDESGTVFIATAAAVFTLPAPSGMTGAEYTFINKGDTAMGVKTATADTLITDGDLTADSVTVQTAAHMIGGRLDAFCDGTSWYVFKASDCAVTIVTA